MFVFKTGYLLCVYIIQRKYWLALRGTHDMDPFFDGLVMGQG